ncbi:uncharacterized protein LOC124449684 [Xenia sp. Carnegie-2017]|nr:uncharacterized protein LOC124449684 [Xenia sp. Carnegie-2017]
MQRIINKEICFMTGTGNNFRLISIQTIVEESDENLSQSLLGFHAFTGCDTTSSFYGKGKKTAWNILLRNHKYLNSFSSLGSAFPPSEELVFQLNRFVCLLYGDKDSEDVNKCRLSLFKAGKCSDEQLPPTCDSLLQHIRRSNYQAAIWRSCLQPQMDIPPPDENGWKTIDGKLQIVWMTIPPAPDSLLDNVNCGCKTGCNSQRCSCNKAGVKCTDVCSCTACTNVDIDDNDVEEEEFLDDDMDDEFEADL